MKNKKQNIVTISFAVFAAVALVFASVALSCRKLPTIEVSGETTAETTEEDSVKASYSMKNLSSLLTESMGVEIPAACLEALDLDSETVKTLKDKAKEGKISSSEFHELTGYTVNALVDKFGTKESKDMGNNGKDSFVLGFTGDINFDEESFYVMCHALTKENGVLDCIDENYQNEMKSADIMLVNNEFPYTDRGTPTAGKTYTFRAKPEYVHYMTDMGVDIVSLANNHAYDYGYDSFVDTISTLNDAGIVYVGAGMNIEEASAPKSFIINGYKVSYLACSGVEYPIKTPVATEDSEGVMGSYDGGDAMAEAIKKAKETSDYVIVYPHWGMENTTTLTDAQTSNSRYWIDAGADAVIGNHSHCLQGMDFYKGKFIAYSLGNFWFNSRNVYTGLLKLEISEDGIVPSIVPGTQYYRETSVITDQDEAREVYDLLESYPSVYGVTISDDGVISEKQ